MLKLISASLLILSAAFGQTPLNTSQIAKRVSPTVVVIQGETDSGTILGSGFIISNDGKIVTNLHVIRGLTTATVQLANGEVFNSVSVLATDELRDIAIIKVAGFGLPLLDLGNSNSVTVGERVIVVGSPRGLEGTVTAGILSSVREGEGLKVLQTDAAVNPGNSGGPLVNDKGLAVGVISFKLRSAEGLNFAIPINYVRGLLNNLHRPISLKQMSVGLSTASTSDQQNDGPSLEKTLDWLKEKIPLATVEYERSENLNGEHLTQFVSRQGSVTSFDSCTVAFGDIEDTTIKEHPEWGNLKSSSSHTVPLGALTGWVVEHRQNEENSNFQFVSGDEWSYRLFLSSTSREIYSKLSFSNPEIPTRTQSMDRLNIAFNDESMAQRVAQAFHHASDLCRKKEAF